MKRASFGFFALILICSISGSCLAMEKAIKLCEEKQAKIDRDEKEILELRQRLVELEKQKHEVEMQAQRANAVIFALRASIESQRNSQILREFDSVRPGGRSQASAEVCPKATINEEQHLPKRSQEDKYNGSDWPIDPRTGAPFRGPVY